MKTGSRKAQKGAVAIEFALVFVIFFAVFYGLVSYSLPFMLMQTFNQATAEAIRRAVAVDPTLPNYSTVVVSTANAALSQQFNLLLPSLNVVVGTDTTTVYDPTQGTLTVSVNYPVSKLNQVIPFLVLPGVGAVPSLPTNLSASSSLKF
jgi:Flp pilus assembly protein TadG